MIKTKLAMIAFVKNHTTYVAKLHQIDCRKNGMCDVVNRRYSSVPNNGQVTTFLYNNTVLCMFYLSKMFALLTLKHFDDRIV